MPTTSSAKKRHRQSLENRARNRSVKHELKTRIRNVREAVQAGKMDDAMAAAKQVTKKLDQAAAKGIIHKNKSSRTKSRIAHLLNTAKPKS